MVEYLSNLQRRGLIVGLVGAAICIVAAAVNPAAFFRSYLVAFVYWFGISMGCLCWLMIFHVAGGVWGQTVRRILESGARVVPWAILFIIPLFFGMKILYPWTDADLVASNHILHHRHSYLNYVFIFIRLAVYAAIWIGLVSRFTRGSWRPGPTANLPIPSRYDGVSGAGLVLYVLTVTFFSFDWLMSIEPLWSSTIYGAMTMVGFNLTAMAFIIFMRVTQERLTGQSIDVSTRHDLGNLMFGFTLLWAYMMLSQFLIIYSANLLEEIPWYIARSTGGWNKLILFNLVFHFVVPFLILLQQRVKRTPNLIVKMAVYMMVMRVFDLFWILYPAFYPGKIHFDWALIPCFIAIGGLWVHLFAGQMRKAAV